MLNKKIVLALILVSIVIISGCAGGKIAKYASSKIKKPQMSYNPPVYSFTPKQYNDPEYNLPLKELPENYQRDFVGKFEKELTPEQIHTLLNNGVVIIPGEEDRFEKGSCSFSGRI